MNPTYNEYFLPILKSIDQRPELEIERNNIYELMIKYFSLSDEEIRLTIPSGTQLLYQNRIGWALTYLTKAGLIIRIRKGVYKLSTEGSRIVSSKKSDLTLDDLKNYKTFVEFISPTNQSSYKTTENSPKEQIDLNPEELLEKTFEKNKEIIKKEIISRILEKTPIFLKNLSLMY